MANTQIFFSPGKWCICHSDKINLLSGVQIKLTETNPRWLPPAAPSSRVAAAHASPPRDAPTCTVSPFAGRHGCGEAEERDEAGPLRGHLAATGTSLRLKRLPDGSVPERGPCPAAHPPRSLSPPRPAAASWSSRLFVQGLKIHLVTGKKSLPLSSKEPVQGWDATWLPPRLPRPGSSALLPSLTAERDGQLK